MGIRPGQAKGPWVGTDIAANEVTAGANVGVGTGQVFKARVAHTLNFRTLLAGTGISITTGTDEVTISSSVSPVLALANVGTGVGLVWRNTVAGTANLKSIKSGNFIGITNNADDITIGLAVSPVTFLANVGTGTGLVWRDTVAGTANLKSIKAGTAISVTNNADDITIAFTGGSVVSALANVGTGTGLVWRDTIAGTANLKSIKAGTSISVTNNADDITIALSITAVTSVANVGTGTGLVWRDTIAGAANLKSIKAGTGVSVTNNADDITVAVTGAVFTGSGINGYTARWTSASNLSTGKIQDNNTTVGINSAPASNALITVVNSSPAAGSDSSGINLTSSGVQTGFFNYALQIKATATAGVAGANLAGSFWAAGAATIPNNYGVYARADGPSAINHGLFVFATGGTLNYAINSNAGVNYFNDASFFGVIPIAGTTYKIDSIGNIRVQGAGNGYIVGGTGASDGTGGIVADASSPGTTVNGVIGANVIFNFVAGTMTIGPGAVTVDFVVGTGARAIATGSSSLNSWQFNGRLQALSVAETGGAAYDGNSSVGSATAIDVSAKSSIRVKNTTGTNYYVRLTNPQNYQIVYIVNESIAGGKEVRVTYKDGQNSYHVVSPSFSNSNGLNSAGGICLMYDPNAGSSGAWVNLSQYAHNEAFSLTDAAPIVVNANRGDTTYDFTMTASRTMQNPSNPIGDGQFLIFRLKQGGSGSYTITWDTKYRFSTDLPSPTLSTAVGKTDILGFLYNLTDDKWDLVAAVKGF